MEFFFQHFLAGKKRKCCEIQVPILQTIVWIVNCLFGRGRHSCWMRWTSWSCENGLILISTDCWSRLHFVCRRRCYECQWTAVPTALLRDWISFACLKEGSMWPSMQLQLQRQAVFQSGFVCWHYTVENIWFPSGWFELSASVHSLFDSVPKHATIGWLFFFSQNCRLASWQKHAQLLF